MPWRRVIRVVGYGLVALALVALGADLLRWLDSGELHFTVIGEHWFALGPGSLNLTQAVVQRYLHPALWDPVAIAVLNLPTVPVVGLLGVLLVVLLRPQIRKRRMFS